MSLQNLSKIRTLYTSSFAVAVAVVGFVGWFRFNIRIIQPVCF